MLTVCEEVGLLGASAMDFSDLEGRILVNIDSEEEGVLTAGCAGGRRVECHLPITRAAVTGTAVKADIAGLAGGHSGTEIHKGRANAIALLGRYLTLLSDHGAEYAVLTLSGGAKENVIPKESSVTLVLPAGITEAVRAAGADFTAQMKAEFGTADPGIRLQLTEEGCGEYDALDANSAERLRKALLLMPWGVQSMSMDVPGLVETSLNLGVAEMSGTEAILRFAIRSSVPSAKELLSCKVQSLTELLGGSVRFHGDYPAWVYARESALRDRCVAVYEAQYGAKPQIVATACGPGMRYPLGQDRRAGLHLLWPEPAARPHPQRARRHCIGGPCVGIPEGYSGLQRVKPSQSQLALCQLPRKGELSLC
ncbi:MAG: peptidase dimerization domain-containing protein [Faecalibacterium sp.]